MACCWERRSGVNDVAHSLPHLEPMTPATHCWSLSRMEGAENPRSKTQLLRVLAQDAVDDALANHVYRFNILNRSPRRVERPETLTRPHSAFDCPMILFHHIVEIANGSTTAAPAAFSRPFEFINYLRIGRITIYVDDPWPRLVWRSQSSLKETFGSICIALRREQKVNGVTLRIHRPI